MGILDRFFRNKANQPQITIEKFNHFFELYELTNTSGYGVDVVKRGKEIAGMGIKKAHYFKGYKDIPAQDVPKHIVWFKNPIFFYVTVINEEVQYRYTKNKDPFMTSPITTDKSTIRIMDEFFEYFYTHLDLPKSIENYKNKIKNQQKITRKNKMKFLENYLSSNDEAFFIDNFVEGNGDINDIAICVDWKEYDEHIIEYCIDILQNKELIVEVDEDIEEERGIDIFITYKGVKTKIEYEPEYTDRDTTIKALNKSISEDYEIRFCKECDGDTLFFVPLTHKQWLKLEKNHPNTINEKIEKIETDSVFFG